MNDLLDSIRLITIEATKAWRALVVFLLLALAGYPAGALVQHGLNIGLWPPEAETPAQFWTSSVNSFGVHIFRTYCAMAAGKSGAFIDGGQLTASLTLIFAFAVAVAVTATNRDGLRRDPSGRYGDARFATKAERARMQAGLELGTDPVSGRPIQVAVKGNLLSIAPPRTGKTSGLLIPNLAKPERTGWSGPAVVIDPKGEAYRAVAERRAQFGRRVVCLDPYNLVGGGDCWNPLPTLDPDDITYLQRLAHALLPESTGHQDQYFQNRAADTLVAGFLGARAERNLTPLRVSQLLSDPDLFAGALRGIKAEPATKTLALLNADPKTRDPVLSTAMQAFQWCDDPRLQRLTARSTFELTDVCNGEADLFVVIPTEAIRLNASFLRWFLTDLFTACRRSKPLERVVVFIDEARALGRFEEIVVAAGELPGYNVSLWTFWQDRSQLISLYGEADAKTLLNTTEIVTVSDVPMIDPQELEHWSKVIGTYTVLEEVTTTDGGSGTGQPRRTSTSLRPLAVPLVPPDALLQMSTSDLLVFPNSRAYAKRPLKIRRVAHDDARLKGLVADLGGTASA